MSVCVRLLKHLYHSAGPGLQHPAGRAADLCSASRESAGPSVLKKRAVRAMPSARREESQGRMESLWKARELPVRYSWTGGMYSASTAAADTNAAASGAIAGGDKGNTVPWNK